MYPFRFFTRCAVAGLLFAAALAGAQDYPAKSIRMIIPFQAGGSLGQVAEAINSRLSQRLGQRVFIEYKPGLSGTTGATIVAQAPADGYTVLLTSESLLISSELVKVPYDPVKDFIPVSQLVRGYIVLIANPRYPANDVKSVIALARDNQGLTSFGSSGSGTTSRLVGEMLNIETKADLLHVPYRGASAARNDVVMRQVDLAFDDLGPALDAARAGRVKMIALASSSRSKIAPNLPTISETYPGISADPMIGVWVRAGTPAAAVERLSRELAAVVRDPAVAKILTEQSYEPVGSSPQEFGGEVRAAQEKYHRIVKAAGVELD